MPFVGQLDEIQIYDRALSDEEIGVLANPDNTCPWDLNGNETVDPTDLLLLLGAWGKNPGHPADFDGDGNVGTSDLIALLGNWGPCPK